MCALAHCTFELHVIPNAPTDVRLLAFGGPGVIPARTLIDCGTLAETPEIEARHSWDSLGRAPNYPPPGVRQSEGDVGETVRSMAASDALRAQSTDPSYE